jgi:hypothetical protein
LLNTHSVPVKRADQHAVRKSNLSLARRIAQAGALARAPRPTGLHKTTLASFAADDRDGGAASADQVRATIRTPTRR